MKRYRLTILIGSSAGTNKQVQHTSTHRFQWMAVITAWWNMLSVEELVEKGIVTSETLIERIDGKQQGVGGKQVVTEQV